MWVWKVGMDVGGGGVGGIVIMVWVFKFFGLPCVLAIYFGITCGLAKSCSFCSGKGRVGGIVLVDYLQPGFDNYYLVQL